MVSQTETLDYMSRPLQEWSDMDRAHWDMLDKFYTQIGSLPELTNLTLRAAEKATSILELPRL